VTERFRMLLLVVLPVLAAACAMQPGDVNLVSSFGEQLAAVDGVTDFGPDDNELTFMGPDGEGGIASWRVRSESTELVSNEGRPLEGHVVSSWYRDGELIEPIGTMYTLPQEFFDTGVAQVCYALWDEAGDVVRHLERYGVAYPNILDGDGQKAVLYGVRGVPEKYVIDRSGNIVRKMNGLVSRERLREVIDSLIAS